MYLLIRNSDGDTYVSTLSEAQVQELLDEHAKGKSGFTQFLSDVSDTDTNYWPEGSALLVKAEIKVPRAGETITKFEV